jgi:hypothetical protein
MRLAKKDGGRAVIKDGWVVIAVRVENIGVALEGAWASGCRDGRYRVTDALVFAEELVRELNREDEIGTTLIHKMLDEAMYNAIDEGAEGVEEHPEQDA